nr:RecName: Full=Chi-conotoxin CMrVIA; AltName: Full=Conotoxin CMrVIA; AltName: Full=Lambda-conotoxin CMrVIA [Conus marmoreus]
VCCGYKLCHPC